MIKKTITYTDFDGNTRIEDAYFNMTRSELLSFSFNIPDDVTGSISDTNELDVETAGKKMVERMGKSGIFNFVKDLVFKAYGVKSEDGRRFIKNDQLATEFTQTLAYDKFLMELFDDDNNASEFISGLIPADMAKNMPMNTLKPVK